MLSALHKLALFILFIPAVVWCQINPHTQIRWPANCQTPQSFYNDQAQTCLTITTTGGLPVTNPQFAGTFTGPYTNISAMSAYSNPNPYGTIVPSGIPNPSMGNGVTNQFFSNIYSTRYPYPYQTSTISSQWYNLILEMAENQAGAGAGGNYWMKPGLQALIVTNDNHAMGSSNGFTIQNNQYGIGDNFGIFNLGSCYGGTSANGDEGCESQDNWIMQGSVDYNGPVTAGGNGSQTVTVNPTQGGGTQGAGRYLMNLSHPISTGSISSVTTGAGTGPSSLVGNATAWPASTVQTTLGTDVNTPGAATVTPGSMTGITTSTVLCVADGVNFEMVKPSAVTGTTFTATFMKAFTAAAYVSSGGLCGYAFTAVDDNVTGSGVTGTMYWAMPVIRSTDATHALLWTTHQGHWGNFYGADLAKSNFAYAMYPMALVEHVNNGSSALSNTLGLMPNTVNWTVGDTVDLPLYYDTTMLFGNNLLQRYLPGGGVGFTYTFGPNYFASQGGTPTYFQWVTNNTNSALYDATKNRYPPGGTLWQGSWQFLNKVQTPPGAYSQNGGFTYACFSGACDAGTRFLDVYGDTDNAALDYFSGTGGHRWKFHGDVQTDGHFIDSTGNPITGGSSTSLTGWVDVVAQGIDNTGATDVSSAILSLINGLSNTQPNTLYFAPGTYKIDTGIQIAATSSTKSGIRIVGAGRDSTVFKSACTNGYAIWYNNTTNSGDNFSGMQISDVQFQDTSASNNACNDVIRFTQTSLNTVERVKIANAKGNTYSTGTVGISGNTVTGVGTTWTGGMTPGVIQVNGVMQEVCTFVSATQLTLCSTGWSKGTVAPGASYALAYGGRALSFDPGFSYTQYISVRDLYVTNSMFCVYSMGTASGGNSRITIDGKAGWCGDSGLRIPNSVGIWLGKHSDTFQVSIPVNNKSRCFALESAHANSFVSSDCEDNATYAVVTTCNGGVAAQSCIFGYELSADGTGSGYGNSLANPYVYLAGTAIVADNANGAYNLTITGLRSASFSNTNSYSFNGVSGCPANSSGIQTTILDWDCVHLQTASTVGRGGGGVRKKTVTVTTTVQRGKP